MKNLVTHSIEVSGLEETILSLPSVGRLAETAEGLVYLDIDDRYIHDIHALLSPIQAEKPPYFDEEHQGVGAHISVFYPEEGYRLCQEDWRKAHAFKIQKLVSADLFDIRYYALLAQAPTLATLRLKYGAPRKLTYKNHLIDFHITVGTQVLLR